MNMVLRYTFRSAHSYILFLALIASSCNKDWLDVKSDQSQAVPATVSDYRAMLDHVNQLIQSSSPVLGEVASDNHTYTASTWNSMKNTILGNAFTWSNLVPFEQVSHWNSPYQSILSLNVVIEGLDKQPEDEDLANRNILRGEALFHRAKIFYDLSQTFSPPYDLNNKKEALGIPLRTSSDITILSNRSTIEQTYDQIISDLMIAKGILPQSNSVITRPDRIAAVGLLARIYLSMEKYDSALVYATEYLLDKKELVDFNEVNSNQNYIGVNVEIGFLNFLIPVSAVRNALIEESFYDKYDENDLRKSIFFRPASGLHRFKGTYGDSQTDIFVGVATDEIYLIYAECNARLGNLDEAMKYVNALARSRYKKANGATTYVDRTANTELDALTIILNEREKELVQRNVRWSDLRRLNKDPRFAKTISRTIDGKTYKLEPNSDKYTFPIPIDVVTKTKIQQNPGWE